MHDKPDCISKKQPAVVQAKSSCSERSEQHCSCSFRNWLCLVACLTRTLWTASAAASPWIYTRRGICSRMLLAASAAASPWVYNRTTIRLRCRSPYSRRWIHTHRSAYLLCAKRERRTEKDRQRRRDRGRDCQCSGCERDTER